MSWVVRAAIAFVVAIVVWLLCIFIGGLIALTNVPLAAYVGGFLKEFAVLFAVLTFIWVFLVGYRHVGVP